MSVIRISFEDDEQGVFTYERNPDDPFQWRMRWPGFDDRKKPGPISKHTINGQDVLWQLALSVLQGTQDDPPEASS